jgi:hypothetical protein
MSKKEGENSVADEHYYMTLYDLANDADIRDMIAALKDYESKEMYEECAGIYRGMQTYKFVNDFYKITENTDLKDKIKINFSSNETEDN